MPVAVPYNKVMATGAPILTWKPPTATIRRRGRPITLGLGTVSYCIRGPPCHRVLSGQPGPIFHPRAFLDIQRYCVRSDSPTPHPTTRSLLSYRNLTRARSSSNVSIRACPTGAVPFSREDWLLLSTRSLPSDNSLCRHSCQTESSGGK